MKSSNKPLKSIIGKSNIRVNNYVKVLRYDMDDNTKYKFIYMPTCKIAGYEKFDCEVVKKKKKYKEYFNDKKFDESISRAKKMIFNYAICNNWDYFFTGTLDPKKYNRSDLDRFHKDFTKWISHLNQYYCCNIKYIIIPELHEDMHNWHLHGFISDIPDNFIVPFKLTDKLPYKLLNRIKSGIKVCNFPKYQKKFGFVDLEPIQDKFAVSAYCTKYITKDLLKSVKEVGAHTYYHSRGLNLPDIDLLGKVTDSDYLEVIKKMHFDSDNFYCKVKWVDSDILDILKEKIEVKYW